VHALVAPVLLRAAWPDALEVDAEAQPPDRQLAQAEERTGAGEGMPVVSADGLRQPIILKACSNTVMALSRDFEN